MGREPLLNYLTTPDQLALDVLDELAEPGPLVVGQEPLTIGQVYRVAYSGASGHLPARPLVLSRTPQARQRVARSIECLARWLNEGRVVYGVNTGFGGTGYHNKSLDAAGLYRLQTVLINGLLASAKQDALPLPFVRGAMLQRVVSNFLGASALRAEVMEAILNLLNHDVVPLVPLKGSLTASGDLVPLAYLAAVLQGEADPRVEVYFQGRRAPANDALQAIGQAPLEFQPKEGLALVNGTSMASAAGCCVAVGALNAYLLTTVLTAFAVCVVRGSLQPYHPFVSEVKPHPGQDFSARLIFNLLHSVSENLLPRDDVRGFSAAGEHRLAQLTYPFRCASQHLAPEYGTILETFHDLSIEINSASDNPLILSDAHRELAISGGNFLGSSVARAMDKLKLTLHSLARLAHAQFKFLVRGIEHPSVKYERQSIYDRFVATHLLPPSAHPADNMGFQGVEIYMDALLSEMNQKVGPHSTTYVSAEKENQAIVSMGLAAARTAHDLLCDVHYCLAAHLLALCQTFDMTTLDAELVRKQEAARQNALVENPRAEELGLLRPLYDFVRQQCGVPTMFTSTRFHTYLEPIVEKTASLELMAVACREAVVPALADGAYQRYGRAALDTG